MKWNQMGERVAIEMEWLTDRPNCIYFIDLMLFYQRLYVLNGQVDLIQI